MFIRLLIAFRMKFAEHLAAHITPEWHKQYITYEAMKDKLYEAVDGVPSEEIFDADVIRAYFGRFDEKFFQYCDVELRKINTFFSEKLAEATRKLANLQSDLSLLEEVKVVPGGGVRKRAISRLLKKDDKAAAVEHPVKKSLNDIKLAFSEFYLSLILLQNYQTLNFTGFRKILKKHDKLTSSDRGAHWRQSNVETAPFYTNKEVDHIIIEIEILFTTRLEGGNRQKAMKRLRVPPLGEKENPWTTFRIGMYLGIFLVLLVIVVIAALFTGDRHVDDWKPALRMYRGVFLVILFVFLLGINTYGWRASGVNHVLIFELDPRNHLTHQQFVEVASLLAVVWTLSVLSYLFSPVIHIPVFANPLFLLGFLLFFVVNPFPIFHHRARRWLLRVLFCIFTAPFHYVGFADFWVADQLNSLTTVLLDFEYLICFYSVEVEWLGSNRRAICGGVMYGMRPLVACLPAWFRFAQCLRRYRDTRLAFPHIVNAGKYSTTFFVVLFSTLYSAYKTQHGDEVLQNNAFFYLWIISAFISTCYTFAWDVKMDWGLLDRNAGENRFLREEIVYPHKSYYYLAIAEDLVLRLSWVLTVSLDEDGILDSEILKTILACLEVFRRFVWNFFRLENEHLNNCGQFRAVRDISIVPLNADDQGLLEKMMDEEDGVTNRRKMGFKATSKTPKWSRHEEVERLVEHDYSDEKMID